MFMICNIISLYRMVTHHYMMRALGVILNASNYSYQMELILLLRTMKVKKLQTKFDLMTRTELLYYIGLKKPKKVVHYSRHELIL